jgi:hypothetical protein
MQGWDDVFACDPVAQTITFVAVPTAGASMSVITASIIDGTVQITAPETQFNGGNSWLNDLAYVNVTGSSCLGLFSS